MFYANVKKIKKLKNAVIREVGDDGSFIGIGSPIFDEFVLFGKTSKKYTAAELMGKTAEQ